MSDVPDFNALAMSGVRATSEGENTEWFTFTTFGRVDALGVTEVDIQPQMGSTVLPSAAGTLSIVSDDANDTFGGTGCNVVAVLGLDDGYGNGGQDISQPYHIAVVLTAGLTPVTVPIDIRRQVLMQNVISGSLGTSAGTITSDIDGDDQAVLRPGDGVSKITRFSVPLAWTGYISNFVVLWSAAEDARITGKLLRSDGTITGDISADVNSTRQDVSFVVFPLEPTLDLIFRAARVGGGGTDNVIVLATIILKRNPN